MRSMLRLRIRARSSWGRNWHSTVSGQRKHTSRRTGESRSSIQPTLYGCTANQLAASGNRLGDMELQGVTESRSHNAQFSTTGDEYSLSSARSFFPGAVRSELLYREVQSEFPGSGLYNNVSLDSDGQ